MAKKEINWLNILFWIFVIALIIMILTRIFGNSATDIQIFISILGIFFTSITNLHRRVGRIESDIKQIKNLIVKEQ